MDRRAQILAAVAAADPALAAAHAAAVVDAVLTHPAVTRELAAALVADPGALFVGAPPVIGRLVTALRSAGSVLPEPACARCGPTDRALTRSPAGGVCPRCRRRQLATACARCGVVKPVAARDGQGRPVCASCADRPQRQCGRCGRVARIAIRARDGAPEVCDGCFQGTQAVCVGCGRRRPCAYLAQARPTCQACRPRALAVCAHCGGHRPPAGTARRRPAGPKGRSVTLATPPRCAAAGPARAAESRAGWSTRPGPAPRPARTALPGPPPTSPVTSASTAGSRTNSTNAARCAPCALRRRTGVLLRADTEHIPAELTALYTAIVGTSTPRSALNWLRNSAGAKS